jgi:hypothetical protein
MGMELLGGLALFLFGMEQMSVGLKAATGCVLGRYVRNHNGRINVWLRTNHDIGGGILCDVFQDICSSLILCIIINNSKAYANINTTPSGS